MFDSGNGISSGASTNINGVSAVFNLFAKEEILIISLVVVIGLGCLSSMCRENDEAKKIAHRMKLLNAENDSQIDSAAGILSELRSTRVTSSSLISTRIKPSQR